MLNFSKYSPRVTWDCWIEETRKRTAQLCNSIEPGLCEQDLFGGGIRCFSSGRVGFAATTKKDDLENTLRIAYELSRYGPEEDLEQDSQNHCKTNQETFDRVENTHHYIDTIRKWLHKQNNTKCVVESVSQKLKYQNSYGRVLSAQRHFYSTVLTRTFPGEGKSIKLKAFYLSLPKNGNSLEESAELFFSSFPLVSSPKSCEMDCLFIEQASTLLIHMLSRTLLLLFKTLTQPKMYESLLENLSLNGQVNLTDAPDEALGFTFDGEGRHCRKVSVMKAGRLVSAIFDKKLAARLGMKTTGNAIRRYNTPPYLDFRTLILGNGNRSYKTILSEMTGVLILEMKDTLVSSNFGEYKLEIIHGLKINKGKVVGRLLGGYITVNLMDLFGKNLLEVGKEYYHTLHVNSVPIRTAKVKFL